MAVQKFKNFFISCLQQSWLQGFYERLLWFAQKGMNFGGGSDLYSSGEAGALKFAKNSLFAESEITIFDVGANVGDFSQLASEVFQNNKLKIFAFEPSAKTFEILKSNLSASSGISFVNKAVGESTGHIDLYAVDGESGLSSVYKRNLEFAGKAMNRTESVEQITLDEFALVNKIENISYLKLDVEGHELSVLKGAKSLIEANKIKFLQFEFGGANIDSRTYFKDFFYLLNPRYKLYRILSRGLEPVENYKEMYEIFITTNYLAVLKRQT